MDKKETNRIFKVTTIFGGASVVVAIGGLLKSKVAAVFLGPDGIGESAIYNNTVLLLAGVLGLGVGQSAIKFIAQSTDSEEKKRLSGDTRLLTILLAVAAFLLTCLFSPLLSTIQFGDSNHIWGFCLVGLAIASTIAQSGTDALLRSYKRTKSIALTSLINTISSVVIYCLFYIIWGAKAIPYVIMIAAFLAFSTSFYYSRDVGVISSLNITKDSFARFRPIVVLGLMMVIASSIDSLVTNLVVYIIRIRESIQSVGMYQTTLSISSMAIGMVYTAIANDYYPSLAECIPSIEKQNKLVNTQMNVNIHLLGPILLGMIVFADFLIQIFLSAEFLSITNFISWIFFACFCLSFSWCTMYLPLAYGHKKRYLRLTLYNCFVIIACQIPLFYFFSLKGLAIGYFLSKILYAFITYRISRRRYSFNIYANNIKDYIIYVILFLSLIILRDEIHCSVWLQIMIVIIGSVYSIYVINKTLDIFSIIKNKLNKR